MATAETTAADGTAAAEAGGLAAFHLEGVRAFMTCEEIESTLLNAGYRKNMRFGYNKQDAPRILVGNMWCSGKTGTVTWDYRSMPIESCEGLIASQVEDAGSCEETAEPSRTHPTVKDAARTCLWESAAKTVKLKTVSSYTVNPNRPHKNGECKVFMLYP